MSHKPSDIINEGVAEEHVKASKPVTVAPPASPPVYRGDFESRGEHKDIIPRTFWVGIWDTAFFTLAGIASVVLTVLILLNTVGHSWWGIPIALSFWAVTAYLTLPRFHAIMTRIYVPDYFIGRTRTPDGLLGDPVNIGIIGSEEQIHQVMQDAGWTRADEVTLVSAGRLLFRRLPENPIVKHRYLLSRFLGAYSLLHTSRRLTGTRRNATMCGFGELRMAGCFPVVTASIGWRQEPTIQGSALAFSPCR